MENAKISNPGLCDMDSTKQYTLYVTISLSCVILNEPIILKIL